MTEFSEKKTQFWLNIAHFTNDVYTGMLNPIMPFTCNKINNEFIKITEFNLFLNQELIKFLETVKVNDDTYNTFEFYMNLLRLKRNGINRNVRKAINKIVYIFYFI